MVAVKKNVMIRINADLAEKAKELGLNISKVCENALIQAVKALEEAFTEKGGSCLLYTSPSPRDLSTSRMPSSA